MTKHYNGVIMGVMVSQITSFTTVYSTVYSGVDQRKHKSSASLAFVWGIHRGPVNSPHKWPVTRKMFPFDDVIVIEKQISYGRLAIQRDFPWSAKRGGLDPNSTSMLTLCYREDKSTNNKNKTQQLNNQTIKQERWPHFLAKICSGHTLCNE